MAVLLVVALFGLIVGSFCNVLIHRLPRMIEQEWAEEMQIYLQEQATKVHDGRSEPMAAPPPEAVSTPAQLSLSLPRSHCPHCLTPLRLRDLVPVLSWLCLRGRCHHCHGRISMRYPLVELASAGIAVFSVQYFGLSTTALAASFFFITLLVAALIDWDSQWLPDLLTLPLLWVGLLAASLGASPIALGLQAAVWGAVIGYMALWLLAQGFRLFTGRDGLGGGDTKLLAALGAWLGPLLLPTVLLAASIIGLLLVFVHRRIRREDGTFPFGPSLAAAGVVLLCQQVALQT